MQSLEGRRVAEAEPESFRRVEWNDAQTEVRASEHHQQCCVYPGEPPRRELTQASEA